ncbi:discoidin domain-containing protein [Glutamicibacter arilaitensis]|uniref:discoidin domain-containing protein n=1 Tax=Glutamicibacter arilaitensis TaxID=256701 RepID=UPI003FD2624C
MKNMSQKNHEVVTLAPKRSKRPIVFAGAVALAFSLLAVPLMSESADAALDHGSFCIKATGFDSFTQVSGGCPTLPSNEVEAPVEPPYLDGNEELGYKITASTNSGDAWKLFDGSSGTLWGALGVESQSSWVQIELPKPERFEAYNLSFSTTIVTAPTAYKLVASNDGMSWETLHTQVKPELHRAWARAEWKRGESGGTHAGSPYMTAESLLPESAGAYKFYRVEFAKGSGPTTQHVGEIVLKAKA